MFSIFCLYTVKQEKISLSRKIAKYNRNSPEGRDAINNDEFLAFNREAQKHESKLLVLQEGFNRIFRIIYKVYLYLHDIRGEFARALIFYGVSKFSSYKFGSYISAAKKRVEH